MKTMNSDAIRNLLNVLDNLDISYRSYSGRGMMGATCLAIDIPRGDSGFTIGLKIGATLKDNTLELLLQNPQEDSMGRDSILYWPRITYPVQD